MKLSIQELPNIQYLIKYADADGNTQYSDYVFRMPEDAIKYHRSSLQEGEIVKITVTEEDFDIDIYIQSLIDEKNRLETLLQELK